MNDASQSERRAGGYSLTIAIPVHNESAGLDELMRRLDGILAQLGTGDKRILFVDDGSTDDTLARLRSLRSPHARVSVIALSRNFGHQAALTAALDHADGDAVVVMDGDLQDAPEDIPVFLDHYERGYDVVYAIRVERKEGMLLRSCYRVFYRMMTKLSSTPLPEGSGDFGLLSRRVVTALRQHREQHRYLRGLRMWVGFQQIGVEVERRERHAGKSQYGLRGLIRLAMDGLFSFSIVPIRLALLVGLIAIGGSLLYAVFALWARLVQQQSPQGFTTLVLAMVFLAGVQLLFLGVIGEYVGRIYEETKGRALYIVDGEMHESAESRRESGVGSGIRGSLP